MLARASTEARRARPGDTARVSPRHLLAAVSILAIGAIAACGARTGLPVPDDCPTSSATATRAPLDVFFVVDSSRSMELVTDDGSTKWQSVREALQVFLGAKDSAGIGAAITFFPHIDPTVPERCMSDGECGVPGACEQPTACLGDPSTPSCATDVDCVSGGACKTIVGVCLPNGVELCSTDVDCGTPGDACTAIGTCEDGENACIPGQLDCPTGACLGLGVCENHTVCASSSYATTEQPVAALPGNSGAILAAMDARAPDGSTPTLSAVTGAIDGAAKWAAANPTHKVVIVLATDGLPTTCDDALTQSPSSTAIGVHHVAESAGEGAAVGLHTYVVGVFAPDEQADATAALDEVAAAGGTEKAFLIQTSDAVSTKLLEALTEVRDEAARCTFGTTLEAVEALDANRARVVLTNADGSEDALTEVGGPDACDAVGLGYFADASAGAKIDLCPKACDAVHARVGTDVTVVFRCGE